MQGPTSSPVGGRGGGVARSSETETRESSATAFHFQTKTNRERHQIADVQICRIPERAISKDSFM